jgi:hypothetical protein
LPKERKQIMGTTRLEELISLIKTQEKVFNKENFQNNGNSLSLERRENEQLKSFQQ